MAKLGKLKKQVKGQIKKAKKEQKSGLVGPATRKARNTVLDIHRKETFRQTSGKKK